MGSFSIYMFFDENNNPFYVGKTNNFIKRKKRHLYEVKRGSNYPNHNKLRNVLSLGIDPNYVIQEVCKGIEPEKIDQCEIYWINFLKKQGFKIKNLTNGGEGSIGFTPEIIKKQRLKRIGQKRSEITKKRMSQARLGIVFSEEHKNNLSKKRRQRIITEKTRKKCSQTSKGKINIKKYICVSPEGREFETTKGLYNFCEEHNLTSANMHKVLKGKRKNHKGWTIRRTTE